MGQINWKKYYAIKKQGEDNHIFDNIPETPGIYIWKRKELIKDRFKVDMPGEVTFWYVGQAKNLKNRRWNYYQIQSKITYPTRHFEASLLKHNDWNFEILVPSCNLEELDFLEKKYIVEYLLKPNHITRNDSLTGDDKQQSNKKRIQKIEKQYRNYLKKLLKNQKIEYNINEIKIQSKLNKDNRLNKKSLDDFNQLKNFIQLLEKE